MEARNIAKMNGITGIITGMLLLLGAALVAVGDITISNINSEAFVYALLAIGLAVAVRGIWNAWKGEQSAERRAD